jgi:hypothetical protein
MAAQRAQKNLTVMFTDISGFTKHTETISREALMSRLDTHNELLMPIVAHFDGRIVKTIGDAFLITFESPTNAVQCGLFMQHTLGKYNIDKAEGEQIHIKVSINSGEVTVTENDVFGDPVNVAAKIEKATNPDEIYFTESVFLAMNKAEVPTSFVKAFRPKGAESSEIKLYKVAMDEGDERYKKVIANTHIDKEKNKTRVLELSNLAEKEFVRYQDTLEALVESQGKSSRGVVIAVIAAAVILAVAVIVGFSIFAGGDKPDAQLAKDVRAYLASDKPGEARTRIDNYIGEFGADDTTATLQNEVRDYEIGQVIADSDALIADSKPEDARSVITKYFGSDPLTEAAKKALGRADAYLNARDQIAAGKAQEAADAINAAFADTNPSKEIKRLREQAAALVTAEKMARSPDRFNEPMRMLGAVTAAFGEDTTNTAALAYAEEALANELFRDAKANGYDVANNHYEDYRKRISNLPTWDWVLNHMRMGSLWYFRTNAETRRTWQHSQVYWDRWRDVRDYVKNKPEKQYRFGCLEYMLARYEWQATCEGADEWDLALKADPSLAARHGELMLCYRVVFEGDRANLGLDLKTDLKYMLSSFTGGLQPMRDMIKRMYYNEMRETLVSYAGSTDEQFAIQRMNALALLTEMGDAELIPDRFDIFRANFDEFVSGDAVERHHAKALFEAPMTLDDYKEFRRLIDTNLTDVNNKTGRFSSYTKAPGSLQALLDDLRVAQPSLTTQFEG